MEALEKYCASSLTHRGPCTRRCVFPALNDEVKQAFVIWGVCN